jgi:hypothetical protein
VRAGRGGGAHVTRLDRALGLAAALAATVGIAWASNLRMTPHASHDAVLRLAWTARPERVEDCKPQSDEALAKLPLHMRQALICEGTTASYRLEVRREGTVIVEQIVHGGGLRHDRPLYVFRDIPLPAGEAAINVRFVRIDSNTTARSGEGAHAGSSDEESSGHAEARRQTNAMDPERRRREGEERFWQRGEAAPALLSLERRFRFVPHEVILVTYDAGRRELLAIEGPSR